MDASLSIDPAFSSTVHSVNTVDITSLGVSGFGPANYATFFDDVLNVWASASGFTNLGQVADGTSMQALLRHPEDILEIYVLPLGILILLMYSLMPGFPEQRLFSALLEVQ